MVLSSHLEATCCPTSRFSHADYSWALGGRPVTYTIVIMLAAVLAKGRSTGREAVIRMLLVAGIMLAPQPGGPPQVGGGAFVLDLSLRHIGTAVPMLITWLLIDQADARRWVPAAAGYLLAWALVADSVVLVVGILPVVVCCVLRLYRALVIRREPPAAAWFETFLAAAAVGRLRRHGKRPGCVGKPADHLVRPARRDLPRAAVHDNGVE